jgi:hypothetical protein
MKAIGLIAELERGANLAHLKSIRELRHGLPASDVPKVCRYLDGGITAVDVMEATRDPLDESVSIPGGPSLVSDGQWVWRRDLSYYVERYAIALDPEFVRHALSSDAPARPTEDEVISRFREIIAAYDEARRSPI